MKPDVEISAGSCGGKVGAIALACLILAAAWLFVGTGTAAAAVEVDQATEIRAERFGTVQVVVTLKASKATRQEIFDDELWDDRRADLRSDINEVVGEVDGSEIDIVRRFDVLPQVVVEVTPEGLAELSAQPDVVAIQQPTLDKPALHESSIAVQSRQFNLFGFTGNEWSVAVLDTGVLSSHEFLAGKVLPGACFTNNVGAGAEDSSGVNTCPDGSGSQFGGNAGEPCTVSTSACLHGTHVAGILAGGPIDNNPSPGNTLVGMAPGAKLVPYQVFTRFNAAADCTGSSVPCVRSYNTDQIEALNDVLARVQDGEEIASVNMSLGSKQETSACATDSRAPIVNELRTAGVAVVIASGNEDSETFINSPGCIPNAITVGSVNKSGGGVAVSGFSNHTRLVDLMAPGSTIRSSILPNPNDYGSRSGTSMATPHVAGAWAAMKERFPTASVSLIEDAFEATGPLATAGCSSVPVIRVVDAAEWIEDNPDGAPAPTDTTAPDVSNSFSPASPGAGGTYTTGSATVNLTATDAGSGVRCIEWRNGLTGAITQQLSSTFDYVASNGSATAQQFNLQYRAIDWADNASNFQSVTFNVRDGVAPVTTHSLNPVSPNGVNGWYTGSPPQITLSATDNFLTPAEINTQFRIGTSGDFTPYTGAFPAPANNPGAVIQYQSSDEGVNTEALKQFTVKTDSVAPSTSSQPTATAVTHPATIDVALAATDATSGVANTSFCVTTGAPCTPNTTYSGSIHLAGIGQYTVAFRSTDMAGNVELNKTLQATIADPTPPETSHSLAPAAPDGAGGWYRTAPTVTLNSTDNLTPSAELAIEFRIGGTGPFNPYTAPFAVSTDGADVEVEYRATDGDGNVEETKTLAVNVDTAAPVTIASGSPPIASFPDSIQITLVPMDPASGPDGTFYCVSTSASCTPSTPYATPFSVSAIGVHTIRFRTVDVAGNLESVKQLQVEILEDPLTVEFAPLPMSTTYGSTFSAEATVLGGGPATIEASGACAISGGNVSPVTVVATSGGQCTLIADGLGVLVPESATVNVAKVRPVVKLKAKPRKARSGKRVKIVATVKIPGSAPAGLNDGKIKFKIGKKRYRKKLKANGTATVRVRVTGKSGRKVKIRAVHTGTANLLRSSASRVIVRIR